MIQVNKEMLELGVKPSVIREMYEYGNRRKAEIGSDKVFDFSLGNPSVPAPPIVNETIKNLLDTENSISVHGYTSSAGDMKVRQAVADYLNRLHGSNLSGGNIYMTCGAAASLTTTFHAITNAGDEVIAFAPFFPEYKVFVEKAGAKLRIVPCRAEDLGIDLDALEKAINKNTKAILLNSPNNPTGVVVSEKEIIAIADLLRRKSNEYGRTIYFVSDEPYRELVYDETVKVPFVPNYYDDTIVCYSFSKSLSLPGERIGYIAVSEKATEWKMLFAAVCGAGRSLGFVCAPSVFQKIIPECIGQTADLSVYKQNRDLFVSALTEYGYKLAKPDGAFYLFVKALEDDATAFCEKAKKHEILIVPSDCFCFPGYARIAYCVDTDMIRRSLPAFKALAEEYGK